MREPRYKKFPYRVTFPDSSQSSRNSQTLEDALSTANWGVNRIWKEDTDWGRAGEPTTDADRAVIVNRNTGYRWIVRRGRTEIEFQTPAMYEQLVAGQDIDIHLTVEEAEALARSAKGREQVDARQKALTDQALDQIAHICRQVRDRLEKGDEQVSHQYVRVERADSDPVAEAVLKDENPESGSTPPRLPYRPLGDPDNLSFKEAGQILGKARNTIHGWYKAGKFPPAVDMSPYLGSSKPRLVVPRYRLEAWQAGERMPAIFQEVFEPHFLREAPWRCWSIKKNASKQDVMFWLKKRDLKEARSEKGKRIFGKDFESDAVYEVLSERS